MFKVLKDKAFVKSFFMIAIPVMIQTLIGLVVNFADNIMVGGVSDPAVSAVYAVNQGTFFFVVAGYGILSGAGIFVQQFFGAKDHDHLKQAFRYKLLASAVLLAIVIPLYYFGGKYLIAFYTKNADGADEIMRLGMQYLPIILLSYIPAMLTTAYATTFREIGKTKIPMLAGALALLTNVVFNYLFIYIFNMGVVGAAVATVMARVVEFTALFTYAKVKKEPFATHLFRNWQIDKQTRTVISKKATPLFVNELLWASGMVLLSLAYSQKGNVLSALAIVSTMTDIFGIVFQGLSVGIGVMVGNLLGAGQIEQAKINNRKLYYLGIWISIIAAIILAIVAFVGPYMFIEVMPEQKILATKLMLVYATFIPSFCIAICSYMTLRAGGKVILTFLFDSCFMWILVVPTTWILVYFTHLDIVLIYIIVQTFDVIKASIGLILVSRGTWANNLTIGISDKKQIIAE